MKSLSHRLMAFEFEGRIFISLTIVLLVCTLSTATSPGARPICVEVGSWIGLRPESSLRSGFLLAALLMGAASLLRIWAGSVLSSHRVMAFRVQHNAILTQGPYAVVRNPIYAADLLAMAAFAICLPPVGLLLPALMALHYARLIRYEEDALRKSFGASYDTYATGVPRLVPTLGSLGSIPRALREFEVSRDGVRHNALYLLFIPGLLVATWTGVFFHAVVIGLPAVLDWAIRHTVKGLPSVQTPGTVRQKKKPGGSKKVFSDILYAQCWEDPQLDRKALRISPRDVVFSITSGGCNCLALLIDNPRELIALDLNPHQSFILELKIAAFKTLSYSELLEFIGVRESGRRIELYDRVRTVFHGPALTFWDERTELLSEGILHAGRYEGYMRLLRTWLQRLIGRHTIRSFFETDDPGRREELYRTKWNNIRWRLFTRIFLSRTLMSLLFDKAFFRYLDTSFSFGKHFASKTRNALTALPVRSNPFLSYILLGNFHDEDALPLYLRKEHFEVIRSRVDRVRIVTDSCESFFSTLADNSISRFNFSNIFEWMAPEAFELLLREVVRVAADGAILTYRNLLVPRERPESLREQLIPQKQLAAFLLRTDRSFIYSKYVIEQVRKGGAPWHTSSRLFVTVEQ